MLESGFLNISGDSDEPMLKSDNLPKSKFCSCQHFAFIFLLIFPATLLGLEFHLYPFPPQIDAYSFCTNIPELISRIEYTNLKAELDKTETKLESIYSKMASSEFSYETLLGYEIAKEMLNEHRSEISSTLVHQQNLWKECISQNLIISLIPLKSKLQLFISNIICLTIFAFFISFLVYGSTRTFFKDANSIMLFNIAFVIQSIFIVLSGILFILASMFYCKLWNLNADKFLDLL